MSHEFRWCAAAGLLLGVASFAVAQSPPPGTPWSNASGTGAFFTWENGQNEHDLFGSPILAGGGTTFVFFPNGYVANAENGANVTRSDRFDVDLHAFSGYKFTDIRIDTYGDYSISGGGSVEVNGGMDLNELVGSHRSTNDSLTPTVPMPITNQSGSVSGQWQATSHRDLLLVEGGVPFTDLHVAFSNNVIAISFGPGGVAQISKTVVGFPIAVTIIPEPGALALLGVAGLVMMRRRR
jgi:hypothetical protein